MKTCECGCGAIIEDKYRFKFSHWQRTPENRKKRSEIASRINKGRVLSEESKNKIRNSLKGYFKDNTVWNKGLTKETDKRIKGLSKEKHGYWKGGVFAYGDNWMKISKQIKIRDNFTCQTCGSKKNIQTHHIDMNKKNNSEENLITLCNSCHAKLHPKGFIIKKILKLNKIKINF